MRSYVLCIGSTGIVDVEFYDFFNDRWQKTGKFTKDNFKLQGDLKMYISKFGKGFNNDDIVVTKFENGRVKESEYFLYGTLSSTSNIKELLNGYRKENFIK